MTEQSINAEDVNRDDDDDDADDNLDDNLNDCEDSSEDETEVLENQDEDSFEVQQTAENKPSAIVNAISFFLRFFQLKFRVPD